LTVQVRTHEKVPLWRNAAVLKWLAQIVLLAAVIGLFAILGAQAATNFSRADVTFGWRWLSDPFSVNIQEGIDTLPDSGARALLVGAINTLRISISGIVAATVLGTLIGIARLSGNWIVNKIATVYVETIRNIPLLVQIFFWLAMAQTLPGLTEAGVGEKWVHGSNKGFAFAWVFWNGGFIPWLVFVAGGVVVGRYVARRRKRIQEETGRPSYPLTFWLLTVVVFAAVGWFAWPLLAFLAPVWRWVGRLVDGLPAVVFLIVAAGAAIVVAALWVRGFFESRRTPAGFGKLTDDDWFRVIFAVVGGLVLALLAFVIGSFSIVTTTGSNMTIAELVRTGLGNVFSWLGNSFESSGGPPLVFERPMVEVRGAGFVQYGDAGAVLTLSFFALWVGVTLYTASFIAEIVRGGILAVSKGQTEAAQSVGLKRSQLLRLVVLPQAFRVILPPMGNQYLNLAKNTSLGIAVAFPDIVQVGITLINQTGQSLPVVLSWMLFFLTLSLSISAVVNYYNRKLRLVER
jgi:general L-amino acid transport system permease protein